MSAKKKQSLAEFIKNEYSRLTAYIRKYIDTRLYNVEPDDIIQDVALSLFTRLDMNLPIENIAGYYYQSLRNRIRDFIRKPVEEKSIGNFSGKEGEENMLLRTIPVKEVEILPEELEVYYGILYESLEELKPEQQDIVIKTELEGWSFHQLAEKTGEPIGTLLARKHRAMAKLSEIANKKLNRI